MAFSLELLIQEFHVSLKFKINFASKNFQPKFLVIAHQLNGYDWRFELYSGYEFRPWRLGLIIYSIPGVIGGLLCIRLPESPKYLLSIKKDNEAYEAVEWIHKVNKGNEKHTVFDIIALKSDEVGTENDIKGL